MRECDKLANHDKEFPEDCLAQPVASHGVFAAEYWRLGHWQLLLLLIFSYVAYERSYKSFNKPADRIYRLQDEEYQKGQMVVPCATAMPGVALAVLPVSKIFQPLRHEKASHRYGNH